MSTESRSTRRKPVNLSIVIAAALALSLALAGIALAASSAQGAKAKGKGKKAPVYAASAEASGFWNVTQNCDVSSNLTFQYRATYEPTTLDGHATLDARKRTGSGSLNWTRDSCLGFHETGSCGLGFETPPPGVHAGDEDGLFYEIKTGTLVPNSVPGLPQEVYRNGVKVDFSNLTNTMNTGEQTGCRGSLWGSGSSSSSSDQGRYQYRYPQGFIRANQLGQQKIVVPFSGYSSGSSVNGDMRGTLILQRLKSKKR